MYHSLFWGNSFNEDWGYFSFGKAITCHVQPMKENYLKMIDLVMKWWMLEGGTATDATMACTGGSVK